MAVGSLGAFKPTANVYLELGYRMTTKKRMQKVNVATTPKITEDNIIAALNKYIEVFNSGTPGYLGRYVSPHKMTYNMVNLHVNALAAAINVVLDWKGADEQSGKG